MNNKKIKLLFVSGGFPGKVHFMQESIKRLGYVDIDTVYRWNYEVSYYRDQRNIIEKVTEKIGLPIDFQEANKRILRRVKDTHYDIIFIVKGNHIYPNTLNFIRINSPNTKIINWSHDNMFEKHNRTIFYSLNLKKYDLVVTTKSFNLHQDQLPSLGARKILFQNNSCYPYPFFESLVRPKVFKYDVSFIGSAELDRFNILNYLASQGIRVKIFGSGWDKSIYRHQHSNLDIECKDLIGKEYFETMLNSKISLSFLRKINKDLQTLRTVEIPFCGAFMIAEDTEEQKSMFHEELEAVFFSSNEDLLDKIKFYLNNDDKREAIAKRGMLKARDSYSMVDNAEEIIQSVIS